MPTQIHIFYHDTPFFLNLFRLSFGHFVTGMITGMRRRAKSDTLYWLVKKLSNWQLDRLKLLNDLYIADSMQWQLIIYYFEAANWSREKELKDWKDKRLDVLKSRTLKWLVRGLSVIGSGPHSELVRQVSDIRMAIAWGANSAAFEILDQAKQSARVGEQFESLLEMLRHEAHLLQADAEAKDKIKRGKAITKEIAELMRRIEDLNRFLAIKVEFLFPYQLEFAKTTKVNTQRALAIAKALTSISFESCLSIRSRYEFHYLHFFVHVHSGEAQAAYSFICDMLDLYKSNPWLSEGRREQYYKDLNRACGLAAALLNKEAALEHLSKLEFAYDESRESRILSIQWYLHSLMEMGFQFEDSTLTSKAVTIFETDRQLSLRSMGRMHQLNIMFIGAKFNLFSARFEKAMEYLNEFRSLRKLDFRGYFVHVRVMELLCQIGIGAEDDVISSAATNTAKYINRQEVVAQIPLFVCRQVERLPSIKYNPKACIQQILNCLPKLRTLVAKEEKRNEFVFLDYEKALLTIVDYLRMNQFQH